MITVFNNRRQRNAHALFQQWRTKNPAGVFINQKSAAVGVLHTSQCNNHHGDSNWQSDPRKDASLTDKSKICARTIGELRKWAKKVGMSVPDCKHCHPDARSLLTLPQADYEQAVEEILFQVESEPLAEEFEGVEKPGRVLTKTYRILRDTRVAQSVKALHSFACQVCGITIKLQDGSFYAEAHHIRPLGGKHKGPDKPSNILCVCPNHHVQMDYRMIKITMRNLRRVPGHLIDGDHIAYHNDLVAGMS